MKTRIATLIILLSCIMRLDCFADEPKHDVFYYQRSTLFAELPIDSTDIVMLGNSLTNGCEWHELFGMPNIKNRGIRSDIIEGIDERLQPVLDGKPAKIFVMTGINDVSHDLTAQEIADQYGMLIDRIRTESPNTKLYVQSCLPINISFGLYKRMIGKDPVIVELNELLAAMAEEKGFTWVDLYPAFLDEDGHMSTEYTNDGLHLLGKGYLKWRDCLLPYILE